MWVGKRDALRDGRGCGEMGVQEWDLGCRSGIWGAEAVGRLGLGSELGFGVQCWGLRGKGGVGCNAGCRPGIWGAGEV